jgi:hypothetical protein
MPRGPYGTDDRDPRDLNARVFFVGEELDHTPLPY